jgi:hypothetical protein
MVAGYVKKQIIWQNNDIQGLLKKLKNKRNLQKY